MGRSNVEKSYTLDIAGAVAVDLVRAEALAGDRVVASEAELILQQVRL